MQFTAALIAALAGSSAAAFCGSFVALDTTYSPSCSEKFVQLEIECKAVGGTPAGNSATRDPKKGKICQTLCNKAPAAVQKSGESVVPNFAVPALANFPWTASIQKQC